MECESQTIHPLTVVEYGCRPIRGSAGRDSPQQPGIGCSARTSRGHACRQVMHIDDAMTQPRPLSISCLTILVLAIAAPSARADPKPTRGVKQRSAAAGPTRHCRSNEEAFRVLKLTTVEDGARVDYEFVRSGQATWTNMNRPLLRQFGVRVGATICLPRDPQSTDTTDFE
jgi:hypothetical protein